MASSDIDSEGKVVPIGVVETPADNVEQHIHRLRSLSKAMLVSWQAGLYQPAMLIAAEIGATWQRLLISLGQFTLPPPPPGGD